MFSGTAGTGLTYDQTQGSAQAVADLRHSDMWCSTNRRRCHDSRMLISFATDSPTGDVATEQLVCSSLQASNESTVLQLQFHSHPVNAGRQQRTPCCGHSTFCMLPCHAGCDCLHTSRMSSSSTGMRVVGSQASSFSMFLISSVLICTQRQ